MNKILNSSKFGVEQGTNPGNLEKTHNKVKWGFVVGFKPFQLQGVTDINTILEDYVYMYKWRERERE